MTPKVSVSLITYNHAPFIAQCIESVLAQRTTFPFELLIGEDDSSDGTREIVRRYADAHPEQIRAFFHQPDRQNPPRRPVPGMPNSVNNLRSARGQYIAMLDGDDYWCDPQKLQRQADYLDAHPDCSTCFHRVATVDGQGAPIPLPPEVPLPSRLTLEDLLQHKFSAPTASVMFRRGLFPDFPEWYFRCPVGDFPLHVMNGLKGDFGFIDREMAAFRVHAAGCWSALGDYAASPEERRQASERKLHQLAAVLELYEILATVGLGPRHLRALRQGEAAFHLRAGELLKACGDYAGMRAHLRQVLRARPFSMRESWWPVTRLLLEAAAPPALRRTAAAWRKARAS